MVRWCYMVHDRKWELWAHVRDTRALSFHTTCQILSTMQITQQKLSKYTLDEGAQSEEFRCKRQQLTRQMRLRAKQGKDFPPLFKVKVTVMSLSHVGLFVTPWTTQSMEFSRPESWSG